MKKYLMIFGIMILSIIPISNVKADDTDKFSIGYYTFPSIVEDENDSFIIVSNSAGGEYFGYGTWLITYNRSDLHLMIQHTGMTSYSYQLMLYKSPTGSKYDFVTYKAYKLENDEWVLTYDRENSSAAGAKYVGGVYNIYYSTEKVYMYKHSSSSFNVTFSYDNYNVAYASSSDCPNLIETKTFSTSTITTGYENVIYEPYIFEKEEYMTFSANFANDLDGIEIYNFRFNAINYNSEYQYLIKTYQEIEWTDITEELNNEANQYDYMLYYNTTLYMQVLDADNNILETKTYTVSDLTDYGLKITHGAASDLSGRYINVITIDTRYIYSSDYKYQYSYDNQVFYDMEITEDNKIYYLFHALDIPVYFRILNAGETIVHEQVYNGDFSNVEKNVLFFDSTDVIDNQKQIIIQVDFTEYLKFYDMYNFRIWVNDIEYDEQTFALELILTEKNYINAIAIKIQVDNLIIEDFTHRIGTINGTGGGSDTDFDGMYDNILENELENELKQQDYSTIPGMVEAVKSFIKATGDFITTFFELIMYFFNKLNVWIKTCVIALFIELVIFKTIKVVRK